MHTCDLNGWKVEMESRVVLGYIGISRPTWITYNPVSNKQIKLNFQCYLTMPVD